LNISESAVSQHLKILREVGVAKGDKRGYYTHYYVNRKVLEEVSKHILELSRIDSIEDEIYQKMSKNHLNYGRSREEIKKDNCQHPGLRPKNDKCNQEQVQKCHGDIKVIPLNSTGTQREKNNSMKQ